LSNKDCRLASSASGILDGNGPTQPAAWREERKVPALMRADILAAPQRTAKPMALMIRRVVNLALKTKPLLASSAFWPFY
jgi:hypothetical protein